MTRGQVTLQQGHIISQPDEKHYLIRSHDCDIAHRDELLLEIIELIEIEQTDGNRTKAKNVRELHIKHNEQFFKLIASSKKSINKTDLLDTKPISRVDESNLRILQKWLSCRYKRHSIPEALNQIIRPIFEDSAKKIKDTEDAIDGVFIAYEEIDSQDHSYEIRVKVVYDSQKKGGDTKATSLSSRIDEKLKQNRVMSSFCEAVSDHELTLAELKSFMEYRLDFLCD